jgi:hypothetical protein
MAAQVAAQHQYTGSAGESQSYDPIASIATGYAQ